MCKKWADQHKGLQEGWDEDMILDTQEDYVEKNKIISESNYK